MEVLQSWKLWLEGDCLGFLNETIRCSSNPKGMVRCVQIALLCLQEQPADCPSMATVVIMLASEDFPLPAPRQPGFLALGCCEHYSRSLLVLQPSHYSCRTTIEKYQFVAASTSSAVHCWMRAETSP